MPERAGVHWLFRVFQPSSGARQSAAPRYTAAEVKAALRQPAADERTRQIHDCLARFGTLVDDLTVRRQFRGLEDYHHRLLRILTLYCRGWEVDAIAADLSIFSTGIGVAQAIDVAAGVIAAQLNRQVAA
jgi:hypothetical protein